jgi:hypothetical protein
MYKFKSGDCIYYPKYNHRLVADCIGLYSIGRIDIELNPHGIDLGYTELYKLDTRYKQNKLIGRMNQFIEYDLKTRHAFLLDSEMVKILAVGEIINGAR